MNSMGSMMGGMALTSWLVVLLLGVVLIAAAVALVRMLSPKSIDGGASTVVLVVLALIGVLGHGWHDGIEVRRAHLIGGLVLLAAAQTAALAAGDAKRGAQIFRQCLACHSTEEGEQMTGPSLAHIWGRNAGTVEGFARYSDAMKHANVAWNEATLDKWLADPERFIPGTSMTFAGLKQPRDRQDVAAYLKALAENTAPQAARGEKGMMGMRGGKVDLRKTPAEAQVKALSYCGDTYTVETADGKKNKVWEFNLRLKTDSSKLGPLPGNPVIVGAGMQGDRASIVFASPNEISGFIKQTCP